MTIYDLIQQGYTEEEAYIIAMNKMANGGPYGTNTNPLYPPVMAGAMQGINTPPENPFTYTGRETTFDFGSNLNKSLNPNRRTNQFTLPSSPIFTEPLNFNTTNTETIQEQNPQRVTPLTPLQEETYRLMQNQGDISKIGNQHGVQLDNKTLNQRVSGIQNRDTRDWLTKETDEIKLGMNQDVGEDFTHQVPQAPNYQTFNPYGGVDLPTAASTLGASIESGNTFGAIASGAKLLTGIGRNAFGAAGRQRRNEYLQNEYEEDMRDYLTQKNNKKYEGENGGEFTSLPKAPSLTPYENGGSKIDQTKLLTGEFITGASPNNTTVNPNSELEKNEYVVTPEGGSMKVLGNTHEKGGENIELEEGDMVISDNLKLKGNNAELLRKKYDIKVKAKDTYATAVDKIYKEIGLTKLIKEEEKILERIKKEQEETKDGTTQSLNLQYLYKQRDKITDKKEKLDKERLTALKTVFTLQEQSKPKEEQSQDKYQDGGMATFTPIDNTQSENELGYYGKVDKETLQNFINRNNWWYDFENFDPTNPEDVKAYQTAFNNHVAKGSPLLDVDGSFGAETGSSSYTYIKDALDFVKEKQSFGEIPSEGEVDINTEKTPNDKTKPNKEKEDNEEGVVNNFAFLPDQGILPPSAMAAQIKINRRYDRVDPNLLSPEQIIQENQRQAQAAYASVQGLPDSQRAAALTQIAANTQEANAQAIYQTEAQNAQILNQAEAQNAQIQMAEENVDANDALSFEKRQQTAQAITEEQTRQYYDYLRKLQTSKFNDIRKMNTVNSIFDNYDINADGSIDVEGTEATMENIRRMAATLKANGYTVAPTKKQ